LLIIFLLFNFLKKALRPVIASLYYFRFLLSLWVSFIWYRSILMLGVNFSYRLVIILYILWFLSLIFILKKVISRQSSIFLSILISQPRILPTKYVSLLNFLFFLNCLAAPIVNFILLQYRRNIIWMNLIIMRDSSILYHVILFYFVTSSLKSYSFRRPRAV